MAAVATLSVLSWHTVFDTEWGFFGLGGLLAREWAYARPYRTSKLGRKALGEVADHTPAKKSACDETNSML